MKRNNLPSVCVFLLMMMGTVIFNSACNNKDDNLVVGDRVPPPRTITIVGGKSSVSCPLKPSDSAPLC